MSRVAVIGATGYTGRLVVEALLARGVPPLVVGRNPEKLETLEGPLERRVAEASDPDALAGALQGCDAVVSCVGPFVDLGEPVVQAALAARTHYIDTTGEQAFMRTVFERYDAAAREAGVALIPAIGFDYVPGDMAAALAARAIGGAEEVQVFYLIRGMKSSDGTKRTGMRVAALPCLILERGELVARPIGSDSRDYPFGEGPHNVALWPGGEPLTVPRHTGAREVRVYMRMPRAAARLAQGAGVAAPALRAGRAVLGERTRGPSPEQRGRGRYEVVAEARSGSAVARCVIEGRDMYGMTAAACAEALGRLDEGFDAKGALAPSEAFEPGSFLDSLPDYLSWRVEGGPTG